jgi:hypothetical protein
MDYTDSKKGDVKTGEQAVDKDSDNNPSGENIKDMASYMSYICTRALLPYLDSFLNKLTCPNRQAHLQFAHAMPRPKITKELVFLPTLKTNFFGNSSALIELFTYFKNIDNLLILNNDQHPIE